MFGWSAEEARRARDGRADRARARCASAIARGWPGSCAGGEPRLLGRRVELTAMRRDGREVPVELAITRIDVPGPPLFTGHVRDISDRKAASRRAAGLARADRRGRRRGAPAHRARPPRRRPAAPRRPRPRAAPGRARGWTSDPGEAAELLDDARAELDAATAELRELARGIHPAVLTDQGLGAGAGGLARARRRCPVDLDAAPEQRLPAPVEATAYFVVAEALDERRPPRPAPSACGARRARRTATSS